MHTKTKKAVETILSTDEAEFLEAFEVLKSRAESEVDLTEEEIQQVYRRLDLFNSSGRKGVTEEELEVRLRAKGL